MPISKRTNHILIVAVAPLNKTFPAAFFILSKRILRVFRIYAILVLWPFNSLTPHQKEIRKVKIFCYSVAAASCEKTDPKRSSALQTFPEVLK